MKRIFKYINVITCLFLLFNFMITPVMAKEVDYVKEDSSNGEYNAMNVLDVFMGDTIVYKDGFVSIKSSYEDGVHFDYYNNNGSLIENNFFSDLYFLDGIVAGDYIYVLLTDDLGIYEDENGDYYSSIYLYKIDSDMNLVSKRLVTDYANLLGNICYLALDVIGYDLMSYVDGQICLFNLAYDDNTMDHPEFSIRKYNTNLDYVDMIDLFDAIYNENVYSALSKAKRYFPGLELFARTTIENVEDILATISDRNNSLSINRINLINKKFYISNLFTNKNIFSTGVRVDLTALDNDYENDDSGERFFNDLINRLKLVGLLKVMDIRENVLVEKEYSDYNLIISPKIINNYIVATGVKINRDGGTFSEVLKTDILLFDLNGNLIDTVSTANGEQLIGFQETKDGFVAKSVNVSDISACTNIPREPEPGNAVFNRASDIFGEMFNIEEQEAIQGIGEIPSKVFDNVTIEGEGTGYCASCRTVVYNLDASLRVSNPTTGSKVLYFLIGLLGIISLFTFTILKSKNN